MAFDILTYTSINKFFLDHLAKTVFDYVEQEHGSDNDNNYEDVTIPFMCDGWFRGNTGFTANYIHPNNTTNQRIETNYMFNFAVDGVYNTENYITAYIPVWNSTEYGDCTIEQAYQYVNETRYPSSYLQSALTSLDNAQIQAETFALRLNDGMSQQTVYSQYINHGNYYTTDLYTINQDTKILDSFTRYNIYQNPPADIINLTRIMIRNQAKTLNLAIAQSSNYTLTEFGFDRTFNLFAITNDDSALQIYNNNGSTYNNTFNYTTNNGDTITVYYGDNYIDLGIGSSGALGAGALVGFNYNDFKLIMDDIIDDLKINVPSLDIPQDYQFPSYDDIKYEDMGDFYIEPLHQYDQLPTAPNFDGTLDLQDYPRAVGLFAGAYLDLIPAGLSVLMTGIFILAIILNNLRGRG